MPPLPGVGERCAPRATWSCIDEPLKPPGRSRSASLPTPGKGRFSRHRLLREAFMSHMAAPRPSRHRSQGCLMSLSARLLRLPSLKAKTSVPPLLNHSSYTALTRCGLVEASHTGSRERGGGLRQTLERQGPQREQLTVDRADAPGPAWATPLAHRLPALARARAALRGAPGARRSGVGGSTQAACGRGACARRAASKVAV